MFSKKFSRKVSEDVGCARHETLAKTSCPDSPPEPTRMPPKRKETQRGAARRKEISYMANEQNDNTKSLTQSESMKRAWARRKSEAVTEIGWFQKPLCLCGCGEPLVRHPNPERQRLFKPGHDARLKSVAAGVVAGEVPEHAIPEIARMLRSRIGFLRTRPKLSKAFRSEER